jgi:hypothetical protein
MKITSILRSGWPILAVIHTLAIGPLWAALTPSVSLVDKSGRIQAFESVQSALDVAKPGETVRLSAGVHRERVRFKNGGLKGAPITLEGETGAILDGSEPVELNWSLAPDIAPGVYRSPLDFFPFTVTANGKTLITLDEKRLTPDAAPGAPGLAKITMTWPGVFINGVGLSGWNDVKAFAMYRHGEKELIVRFKDELDPRTLAMTVAPLEPVILIDGVDRCVVRGLTLRNSAYGVLIKRSTGSVVERCTISPADYGVELGTGADRCTVRFNRISLAPYYKTGPRPWKKESWDVWQSVKSGGFYDRFGIGITRSAGGHEIHDNLIFDHWDGIDDHGNPPWGPQSHPPTENTGLRVHHNLISNLIDDGIETMGAGIDGRWHDNIIERTQCAVRIKAPQTGPLYIYRNLFWENLEDLRNWGQDAQFYPEAVVWVYHNTSTADSAVTMNYGKITGPVITPNYHYLNNLFWCRQWVGDYQTKWPLPDWEADHNVFVRVTAEHPRPWDKSTTETAKPAPSETAWLAGRQLATAAGRELHSLWVESGAPGFSDASLHDLSLSSNSPARRRGTDLSRSSNPSLPGCEPGYFKGDAPDAGALQAGEPMPRLPRDPDTVDTVPAGNWP